MKISLVVACRNRDGNLEKLFESICAQTIDPSLFELIVVNYGGPDSTKNIFEKYKFNCPAFYHYIDEKGVFNESRSKNIGVRLAHNEWVFCVNADIILPEDTLQKVLDAVTEKGKNWIYQVPRFDCPENFDFKDYSKAKPFSALACGDFQGAHIDIWNELCGYDEHMTGWGWMDNDFVLRAVAKGYPQCWIKSTKIYHQYHPENAERKSHLNIIFTQHRNRLGVVNTKWGKYPLQEKIYESQKDFIENRNIAFMQGYSFVGENLTENYSLPKNPKTEILFCNGIKIKNELVSRFAKKIFQTDVVYSSRLMRIRSAVFCNEIDIGVKGCMRDLHIFRQCTVQGLIIETEEPVKFCSGVFFVLPAIWYCLIKFIGRKTSDIRQKEIQITMDNCEKRMEEMKKNS